MKKLLTVLALGAFLFLPKLPPPTHWLNPRLFDGTVLEATYTPTPIKSIQRNFVSLAGVTTNTQTITSVPTANSRLKLLGTSLTTGDSASSFGYIQFTSATVITGTRVGTAGTMTLQFEVDEYLSSFVKSVQRNTISLPNTATGTVAVSAVTTTKSELDFLGNSTTDAGSGNGQDWNVRVDLTSNILVTATVGGIGSGNSQVASFQLFEWR